MRTCSRCKTAKPRGEYYRDRRKLDGCQAICKACTAEERVAYRGTPYGQAARAWLSILHRLRSRDTYQGRELRMTREEFMAWAVPIYASWDASRGRPTVDRIDNDGHYELSNLQIISMSENSAKDSRIVSPDGQSWCGGCQAHMDRSCFTKNRAQWDGLSKICRECEREKRRRLRAG